jgi:hypothetical protein
MSFDETVSICAKKKNWGRRLTVSEEIAEHVRESFPRSPQGGQVGDWLMSYSGRKITASFIGCYK